MRRTSVAVGVVVASSTAGRLARPNSGRSRNSPGNVSPATFSRSGGYVGAAVVEQLREGLSERDWAVVREVARLRLSTGAQLERLHFWELAEPSRAVVRRRVLGRLVRTRVLGTLTRRIGGVRAGSSGLVYTLDIAGKRLMATEGRPTRPGAPGERYVRHTLAVTELYVTLAEQARAQNLATLHFKAEPGAWWPDGQGGRLKPDAYAKVQNEAHTDHWWIEVDRATEHLTTIKRKLTTYADFWTQGGLGPNQVMPWVLVSVPDSNRCSQIVRVISQMPREASELFTVVLHNDAAGVIMRRLSQS
jgi:hypothetical protein